MKKKLPLAFTFLTLFLLRLEAQLPSLAVSAETKQDKLLSTDPSNNKYYYKQFPFTLKTGMGALIYMQSTSFKPRALLFSPGDGKFIGTEQKTSTNGTNESAITFIAPHDTTFLLILTSMEENATGDFLLGYSILDSMQMNYRKDFTTCQKLYYLINQWQLSWTLIPVSKAFHADTDEPESSYEYKKTNNTLLSGSENEINGNYTETLFSAKSSSNTDYKDAARNFYTKVCNDIRSCLDMNDWKSETETSDANMSLFSAKTEDITHFYIKNASKNATSRSFKIVYVHGDAFGIFPYEVKLIFN